MTEWAAAGLGLVNQWLTIQRHLLCWPVGIASVLLYLFVFYEQRLYSDMLLQAVYIVLQGYGWWNWAREPRMQSSSSSAQVHVVRLKPPHWLGIFAAFVVGATALGTAMARYTDAGVPYGDAGATMLSLLAQWLQARKVLESWLVFIVANGVFITIYLLKGLYPTVGLFCVLTALAVFGFIRWRTVYRSQSATEEKTI